MLLFKRQRAVKAERDALNSEMEGKQFSQDDDFPPAAALTGWKGICREGIT